MSAMLRVHSPKNFVGGLLLIALALIAFWQGQDLPFGRAMKMGPGYFPRVLSVLICGSGVILVAMSFYVRGSALERWSLWRMCLVLAAIAAFAYGIRPLGLVPTGALLVAAASVAAPDVRWRESLVFGACLLLFTVLLFVYAIGLPLQLWPAP